MLSYAETDWLASKPVFYNEKNGNISYNINDVIDYENFDFSAEGLNNYLKYGYSVFGQTMVQDVKFLKPNSVVYKNEEGILIIKEGKDSAESLYGVGKKKGEDVFEEIEATVKSWAKNVPKTIVLPLSGGFDSRLLAMILKNDEKIKAFSYGFSENQKESYEVVKAQMVAEKMHLDWQHIPLGDFHLYCDEWYDLFGVSTHLHGMYQMEFYHKIIEKLGSDGSSVLSGIIGDIWAGNLHISDISSPKDLEKLGYTHGMCISEDVCLLKDSGELREQYYEENCQKLKEENWRIIFAMRQKIMLLSYLFTVPSSMGLLPWSPFLDINIAMDMLNLDWEEKNERKWQKDLFDKMAINYGWEKKKCDYNMTLNMQAIRHHPLRPLNVNLLSRIIKKDYVEMINRKICQIPYKNIAAKPRTVRNFYNKMICHLNKDIQEVYYKYMVLVPIERLLVTVEKNI